jgi:hypothetical protein
MSSQLTPAPTGQSNAFDVHRWGRLLIQRLLDSSCPAHASRDHHDHPRSFAHPTRVGVSYCIVLANPRSTQLRYSARATEVLIAEFRNGRF